MTFEKKNKRNSLLEGEYFIQKTITGFKKVTWKLTAKRCNRALNAV